MKYVIPFATPIFNWPDLQIAYKQFGKDDPTRSYQQLGLNLQQASAFVSVFKDRDFTEQWTGSQISISFLIILPTFLALQFEEMLYPITFHCLISDEHRSCLLLGIGTLNDWKFALKVLDKHIYKEYNDIHKELAAYIRKYDV